MAGPALTDFSVSGGCGCKIAPHVLSEIIETSGGVSTFRPAQLLVGSDTRDDAAAFDIGDGTAILSTTDFFAPVVDDPFEYGRVAATNALSDIYAMGGRPIMALAILGWPTKKLSVDAAAKVLAGGRSVCESQGVPLCGGHSIDTAEPIFGLAVTGRVAIPRMKRNCSIELGSTLYLTKPLGVGIICHARKSRQKEIRKVPIREPEEAALDAEIETYFEAALASMLTPNTLGHELAEKCPDDIAAMTDVTGFGFLGHLLEMCQGDGFAAMISDDLPVLPGASRCAAMGYLPGAIGRNWDSCARDALPPISDSLRHILCDPQTSGGLLIAVRRNGVPEVEAVARAAGCSLHKVGSISPSSSTGLKVCFP
eukprot:Polyplicarium_translucidae@DN4653_c0_g1_i1.p1